MTTMTHPPFAESHHHPATTVALVFLFWLLAAIVVVTAHAAIDPHSVIAGTAVALGAIFVAAYAYTRLCACRAGVTHALGVGIAWLVLAITAELTMAGHLHHVWFGLLGAPVHPLLRNVFLFVWVFAPAFFAHRQSEV